MPEPSLNKKPPCKEMQEGVCANYTARAWRPPAWVINKPCGRFCVNAGGGINPGARKIILSLRCAYVNSR
ncbi:MAG TPA: hypothetical protein DCL60_10180 [Armatimonadetes bacterium]|nr:hypothetical protein [Armatimonadota bacterium]